MAYKQRLGQREWGRSPSGERIFHTGYCHRCQGKAFLCETEFRAMIDDVGWHITDYSFWQFIQKKYHIKLPHLRVEWGSDIVRQTVHNSQK